MHRTLDLAQLWQVSEVDERDAGLLSDRLMSSLGCVG